MLAVRESFQMEGSDLGSDPAAGTGNEIRPQTGGGIERIPESADG